MEMKHERFSELLVLSFYGELSTEENVLLTDHLLECPTCRKERAELKGLHSALLEEDTGAPEHLLWQARDELFTKLRSEAHRSSSNRRRWKNWLSSFNLNWATAGGAFATLSIGFLVGYFAFAPEVESEMDPFSSDEVRITSLLLEEKNGAVQLTFEAARSFQLEGSIRDPKIQRFLAYALVNEQNAGTRLRAVNTIQSQIPTETDRHILGALLAALKRDENPAVRQQALSAIQKYSLNDDIKEALVYVLMHDQNAKLRIEAINALEKAHLSGQPLEQDVLGALQQKLETDENKYIRLRAKAVLEEIEPQFF
jgi:hypothetical protein